MALQWKVKDCVEAITTLTSPFEKMKLKESRGGKLMDAILRRKGTKERVEENKDEV